MCSGGQCVAPGCDDKDPCTLDSCNGGQCAHTKQQGCMACLDESFAAAPDFSGKVSSEDAAHVAWQLSAGGLGSQPFALSAVWTGAGSGSGVVVATYQTAPIRHAAPANLTFQLDATLGDAACGADDLEVWLGGTQIKQVSASTGGAKTIVVALPADGTALPIEFRVRAGKGSGHSGAVILDDIQVGSGCPTPDVMPGGLCPTGKACNSKTGVCGLHAVIGEVSTVGPGGTPDSFIELYNPGSGPMALSGARLQWRPVGAAWQDVTQVAGMTAPDVPSHGFYLIATQAYSIAIAADLALSANINFGTSGALRLLSADGKQLDLVGWGTAAPAFEGSAPAPVPAAGSSIERRASATSTGGTMAAGGAEAKVGNGFDSDVSVFDWLARAKAEPQSLASPNGDGPPAARVCGGVFAMLATCLRPTTREVNGFAAARHLSSANKPPKLAARLTCEVALNRLLARRGWRFSARL